MMRTDVSYRKTLDRLNSLRDFEKSFLKVCEQEDVPLEALRRLLKPAGETTLQEAVRLIRSDWEAEKLKEVKGFWKGTFKAPVNYSIQVNRELGKMFGERHEKHAFKPVEACRKVVRRNRELEFDLFHPGFSVSEQGILSEIQRRNWRPALFEELVCCLKYMPDEIADLSLQIVTLGSVDMTEGVPKYPLAILAVPWAFLSMSAAGHWDEELDFLVVRN